MYNIINAEKQNVAKRKNCQRKQIEKYEHFLKEEQDNLRTRTRETLGEQVVFQGEVDMEDDLAERDVRLLENQYRVFIKTTSSGQKRPHGS